MKIGVLGCFYGCDDLLPEVLAPWLQLKEEGFDIDIAAVHTQFKEYAELRFPNDDAATIDALRQYEPHFSSLDILPHPQSEMETRTLGLKRLQDAGADFLWLLLQHVLPKGFRRVRNFGFLHPNSKRLIQLLHYLLKMDPGRSMLWIKKRPPLTCRCCGGEMKIVRTRIPPIISGHSLPDVRGVAVAM